MERDIYRNADNFKQRNHHWADQLSAGVFLGLLLWLACSLFPSPARAEPAQQASGDNGLGVTGAIVNVVLAPGQTYVHHMLVSNESQMQALEVSVLACGFGETLDGGFTALTAGQDSSPYSARKFITNIDHSSFSLAPGASQPVAVTIQAPADMGSNEYYAIVSIQSQAAGSGDASVGLNSSIIVPVLITPPGMNLSPAGRIKGLSVGKLKAGKPVEMLVTVKNTGKVHFKFQGEVTLKGSSGSVLSDQPIPLTYTSLIPTFSRRFELLYTPADLSKGLANGSYTLEARITLADGTLIDDQKYRFVVPAPNNNPGTEDTATPTNTVSPGYYYTVVPVYPTLAATTPMAATETVTMMPVTAVAGVAATLESTPLATLASTAAAGSGVKANSGENKGLPAWQQIALILIGLIGLSIFIWFVLERRRQKKDAEGEQIEGNVNA